VTVGHSIVYHQTSGAGERRRTVLEKSRRRRDCLSNVLSGGGGAIRLRRVGLGHAASCMAGGLSCRRPGPAPRPRARPPIGRRAARRRGAPPLTWPRIAGTARGGLWCSRSVFGNVRPWACAGSTSTSRRGSSGSSGRSSIGATNTDAVIRTPAALDFTGTPARRTARKWGVSPDGGTSASSSVARPPATRTKGLSG
jgi:hypothetical protein